MAQPVFLVTELESQSKPPHFIRVKSLFNKVARLRDGQKWLADPGQVNDTLFKEITNRLANLLQLEKGQTITREKEEGKKNLQLFLSGGWQPRR